MVKKQFVSDPASYHPSVDGIQKNLACRQHYLLANVNITHEPGEVFVHCSTIGWAEVVKQIEWAIRKTFPTQTITYRFKERGPMPACKFDQARILERINPHIHEIVTECKCYQCTGKMEDT